MVIKVEIIMSPNLPPQILLGKELDSRSGTFNTYELIGRQDSIPDTDDFKQKQNYSITSRTKGRYLAIHKQAPGGMRHYLELEEVAVYTNVCEYS